MRLDDSNTSRRSGGVYAAEVCRTLSFSVNTLRSLNCAGILVAKGQKHFQWRIQANSLDSLIGWSYAWIRLFTNKRPSFTATFSKALTEDTDWPSLSLSSIKPAKRRSRTNLLRFWCHFDDDLLRRRWQSGRWFVREREDCRIEWIDCIVLISSLVFPKF